MWPIIYIAIGFAIGHYVGKQRQEEEARRREANVIAARKEANEALDSIGRLAAGGALKTVANLEVKSGDAREGTRILITTHETVADADAAGPKLDETGAPRLDA